MVSASEAPDQLIRRYTLSFSSAAELIVRGPYTTNGVNKKSPNKELSLELRCRAE
ncbi:3252_t:CDS:2, partial [Gigaspora rosea]